MPTTCADQMYESVRLEIIIIIILIIDNKPTVMSEIIMPCLCRSGGGENK
jgi:hypothetical protein